MDLSDSDYASAEEGEPSHDRAQRSLRVEPGLRRPGHAGPPPPGKVAGADPSTDLAVLTMTGPSGGLTPAGFGDSAALKVGDPVMAIGNPLGLSDTVTTGIVSALNRPVSTTTEQQPQQQQQNPFGGNPFGGQSQAPAQAEPVVTDAIQTDAAINPGNSGGALVDTTGQVVGVTSSIASLDGSASGGQSGNIGLGFAIPASEATDVAHQLLATGSVKHSFLGVSIGDGTTSVGGAQQHAAIIGSPPTDPPHPLHPRRPADSGGPSCTEACKYIYVA